MALHLAAALAHAEGIHDMNTTTSRKRKQHSTTETTTTTTTADDPVDDSSSSNKKAATNTRRCRKAPHELLTEAEKKANHIASEQKRRQNIRLGFDQLIDIVPSLNHGNRSVSLLHILLYLLSFFLTHPLGSIDTTKM